MKPSAVLLLTWVLLLSVTSAFAQSDDAATIERLLRRSIDALNNQDADGFFADSHSGATAFTAGLNPGLLLETPHEDLRAGFDVGLRYDVALRHVDVRVYGDTAVSTYYLAGSVSHPNASTQPVLWRGSSTWTKQNGQWKTVHIHNSPLIPPAGGS